MPTRTRPWPPADETMALVKRLYREDASSRKRLRPVRTGQVSVRDGLPVIKRAFREALEPQAAHLSRNLRLDLLEWAATYGLETRGTDPRTHSVHVRLTTDQADRLAARAKQNKTTTAQLALQCVLAYLATEEEEN